MNTSSERVYYISAGVRFLALKSDYGTIVLSKNDPTLHLTES